ncbi:MAG TPA: glycosyltransferase family 4 protein [Candidatus Nanoarchaeia archaeon]|nr:glycosyltransferase family 4 protein [Candidatus Nanoarchaeia archaeon]
MKVLFVNREMAMNPGGGENVDRELAAALKKLGIEVKFMVGKPLFGKPRVTLQGFSVEYIPSPYLRGLYQKLPFPFNLPLGILDWKLFCWSCLNHLKKRNDYDLLQVLSLPELVKIKDSKPIPIVMRFPGPPAQMFKNDIRKVDAVIANGDALIQIRKKFRRDAIEIQIGMDLQRFKPSPSKSKEIRGKLRVSNAPLILYTGRFMPIKNVSLLITAMRFVVDQQSNAKLILVGEGPLEGKLRGEVKRLGLEKNVIFAGRVTPGIESYYAAADVFCMPSLYDNFPNSVLEAMSSGLPIVATNVGGIPLQVKDGKNGFLVPSGDEVALAEKILMLLNSPTKAKRMGTENRKWVMKHFSWEESARKLKRLYEQLINEKRHV